MADAFDFGETLRAIVKERSAIVTKLAQNAEKADAVTGIFASRLAAAKPTAADTLIEEVHSILAKGDHLLVLEPIEAEMRRLPAIGEHAAEQQRLLSNLKASVTREVELLQSKGAFANGHLLTIANSVRSSVMSLRSTGISEVKRMRNVLDQRIAEIADLHKQRIDMVTEQLTAHVDDVRAVEIMKAIERNPAITVTELNVEGDAIKVVEAIRDNVNKAADKGLALDTEVTAVRKAATDGGLAHLDEALEAEFKSKKVTGITNIRDTHLEATREARTLANTARVEAEAARVAAEKLNELGTKVKTFEAEFVKTNDTLADLHKTRAEQLKQLAGIAPAEAKLLAAGQPVADVTGDAAKIIAQIEETQGKIAAQYKVRSELYTAIKGEASALEGAAAHLSEIETISQRASTTLTKSIEKFTGVRLDESIARAGKSGATAAANAAAEAQRAAAAKAAQLKGVTDTLGEKTKLRMTLFSEIQSEVNALTPELKGAGVSKGLNNGLHLGTPKATGSVQTYIDFLKGKNLTELEGVITKLTTLQGLVGEEATALKAVSDVVGDVEASRVLKGLETGIKDAAAAAEQIALKAKDLGKHLDDLVGQRIRVDEAQGAYVKAKIALDGTHKKVGAAFRKALTEVPADVQGAARDKQALEAILANDSNEYKQIKRLAKGKIELLITEADRLISTNEGESRILAQITDATQGKPQAQVNALLSEVDKLVAHTRSEHLSADKIAELRNGLKAADSFDTARTKITGASAAAASHIEEALAKLRGTADTLADSAKAAGKIGAKGWMVVGAAGVIGAITAVLAFGDKPRQTHAERIRQQSLVDPTAMGLN